MRSLLSIVRYVSDDSFSSEMSRFANCSWVAWEGDRGKDGGEEEGEEGEEEVRVRVDREEKEEGRVRKE